MRRTLIALFTILAVSALVHGWRAPASAAARDGDEPILVPFVVESAREPAVVSSRLLVVNASRNEEPLVVEELAVAADGIVIHRETIEAELVTDPRYAELNALIERMPAEVTHLHRDRRHFAADDAPDFGYDEISDRWAQIDALSGELRNAYARGEGQPFIELPFLLPLDQVFFPGDLAGAVRELEISITSRRGRATSTTSTRHRITRLASRLAAPSTLARELGDVTLHAGDLHVHSCHGEAVNACAPSGDCPAESFQTSGSFSYADLKTQYQALGLDWFTATDHSYCINNTSEYQTIVNEVAALVDGSFLAIPDIELSSEEEGPQNGSDLANILCLLGPDQNHMGAHGITSRKEGGSDGFLGFCNGLFSDALDGFQLNASRIRAEGGYPIINHPAAGSYAWNSFASTQGIEGNQMHGVEIWNEATQSGQGGHVASWTDALLTGRILYAYSGSDTHDAAFEFGANHAVFVGEPFDRANLERIVKAGRLFISNGHVLILEVVLDDQSLMMGVLQSMSPTQPADPLTIRMHYNFGGDTSRITLFRGRVGDGAETTLVTSPLLTGEGVYEFTDTLQPSARSWYRAYCDPGDGSTVAYTNPVFFLPSSHGWSAYGTGLGGANVATLASDSSPAIGSVNRIDVSGYSPAAAFAVLGWSWGSLPGVPVLGGFLLITLPQSYLTTFPLVGGAGFATAEIPFDVALIGAATYWQSGTVDPGQPGGFAFSNGLSMTIGDILD